MSNSLMSQQLQSIQMGQVEPMSNKFNASLQMGVMGQGNEGSSQQFSVGNMQMGMMGAVSTDLQSQQTPASNYQVQQPLEHMANNLVMPKLSANMQIGHMDAQANNRMPEHSSMMVSQQTTVLTKRKAPMEASSNGPGLQKLSMPKSFAQMEHRPWLQHISSPKKLPVQSQPISSTTSLQRSHPPSKRSGPGRPSLQQLTQKNLSGQPSPRIQSESSESVRSKLRESLAGALALVSQEQDTPSGKNSGKEDANPAESKQGSAQPCGDDLGTADTSNHLSKEPKGSSPAEEDPVAHKYNSVKATVQEVSSNNFGDCAQALKNDAGSTISMRDEDSSFSDCFFVKDELLQGNGLSWVLETEMGAAFENGKKQLKNPEGSCPVIEGPAFPSPEVMASKIEAELYKLFGGVNKKYKEKGRSLLFNLKDRNNPELRARVMSGEILPDRLCSMTAEELASKELSEWRMAKAEELAQMVVLPDTDVDMRRLVKKTHKGEFQVEVEPEDSISTEVAIGASLLSQARSKPQEKEASSTSKPDRLKDKKGSAKEKSSTEHKNVLMIPSNDGNDLMQGLMVDDDLKDAEFLPPIVSLDEFMESLDSEPPFENLSVDKGKPSPVADKDDSQVSSRSKSPDATLKNLDDTISTKADDVVLGHAKSDANGKSSDGVKLEKAPPVWFPKGERVWEGLLQLNISALATVIGVFKSGEKTSAKDWPGLIEIKGRVRLDAFEKFLQELPMSRSRAVMAVHFVCKDGPAGSESAGLSEVADSYVGDSRVGFSEPAPGVELYFCPPHAKTCEMLSKVLPKDQVDALNAIENGLIGVVVWRKPHIVSAVSPNSTSHNKHNSKKQHFTSRRHQERDSSASVNMDVNVAAKQPFPADGPPPGFTKPQPDDNDDDDLPPGFGPPGTRDEDDLPEFNFSSGPVTPRPQFPAQSAIQGHGMAHIHPNSQTHSRPVEQMRELVHRYGQSKTGPPSGNWHDKRGGGVVVQPWDDDDDMPEWRPEDNKPQVPHPLPHPQTVHGQPPILRPNMAHETPHHQQIPHPAMPLRPMLAQESHEQPGMGVQPQRNAVNGPQYTAPQWQQGPWMVQQNSGGSWQQGPWMASNSGGGVYQNNGGQFYGASGVEQGQHAMAWRRDAPTSRGF